MKLKITKNRCFLLVIASWLMARLWWTLEMSRLAIYRIVPQKEIVYKMHANLPEVSTWNHDKNRTSVLGYSEHEGNIVVYKLPEINDN